MKLARFAPIVPALAALSTLLVAEPASAQFRCPPGFMRNRWGRCVPFGARVCPPGTALINGVCQAVAVPVQPVVCPPGTAFINGVCQSVGVQPAACPPGWFWFRGRCRPR